MDSVWSGRDAWGRQRVVNSEQKFDVSRAADGILGAARSGFGNVDKWG